MSWIHSPIEKHRHDQARGQHTLNDAPHRSVQTRRGLMCLATVMLLSFVVGCNNNTDSELRGAVTGTVSVKGKPLTGGRVNFISNSLGTGAGGNIKPDGTYALEGPIPMGSYNVFITFEISPAQRGTAAENIVKTVPEKYQSQATSDLKAEVDGDLNEHNFDLK